MIWAISSRCCKIPETSRTAKKKKRKSRKGVLVFILYFRKKGVYCKFVTKTLYRNVFSNKFVIVRVASYQRLIVCKRLAVSISLKYL